MRKKPSAYEDILMHLYVFEYLLPSASSQPSLPFSFMKSAEDHNIPKIFPFQVHHWPIICELILFSPFFSISLQKNYSQTASEIWICVWVKHPVLDWRSWQAPRMWLWQACRQLLWSSYILFLSMNVVVAVKHLPWGSWDVSHDTGSDSGFQSGKDQPFPGSRTPPQ